MIALCREAIAHWCYQNSVDAPAGNPKQAEPSAMDDEQDRPTGTTWRPPHSAMGYWFGVSSFRRGAGPVAPKEITCTPIFTATRSANGTYGRCPPLAEVRNVGFLVVGPCV